MTPRSARVSLRCFRRVLAWTRRAVWLMAFPVMPCASRITGPACRATRSCMRRASPADWLWCLSAVARRPSTCMATALAGATGGITIRAPSPRSSVWNSRQGSLAASNACCSRSYMMRRRFMRSSSLRLRVLKSLMSVSRIGQIWPVQLAAGRGTGIAARTSAPAHASRPPAASATTRPAAAASAATRPVAAADSTHHALIRAASRRQDRRGRAVNGDGSVVPPDRCSVPTDLEAYFCVSMAHLSRVFQT
jgi:hypothetical protein